jgi:hypothetical protein
VEPESDEDDNAVDETSAAEDERHRRNGRVLVWIIGAGAVAVVVIAVVGFVLIRHYLDDATSPTAAISAKYQREYRNCVLDHTARQSCAAAAERACVGDARWTKLGLSDAALLDKISSVCVFGPDRSG